MRCAPPPFVAGIRCARGGIGASQTNKAFRAWCTDQVPMTCGGFEARRVPQGRRLLPTSSRKANPPVAIDAPQAHRGASARRNRGRFPAESQRDCAAAASWPEMRKADQSSGPQEGLRDCWRYFRGVAPNLRLKASQNLPRGNSRESARRPRPACPAPSASRRLCSSWRRADNRRCIPVHPFEVLFQRGRLHAKLRCDISYASPSAEVVRQKGFRMFGYAHLAL